MDIYNRNMELTHTLLDKDDYMRFLFYPRIAPSHRSRFDINTPSISNTYYSILKGGRLVILLTNSSRAFIFENNKMTNHFDVWPKKSLEWYNELNSKSIKERRNGSKSYVNLMYDLFPDIDDPPNFYLFSFPGHLLYKISLDGKLIHAIENVVAGCRIQAKRNGLFYGISPKAEYIRIFKIKKEKKK